MSATPPGSLVAAPKRTWKCVVFGHKFENWAGRVFDFCLRCGMRHE